MLKSQTVRKLCTNSDPGGAMPYSYLVGYENAHGTSNNRDWDARGANLHGKRSKYVGDDIWYS